MVRTRVLIMFVTTVRIALVHVYCCPAFDPGCRSQNTRGSQCAYVPFSNQKVVTYNIIRTSRQWCEGGSESCRCVLFVRTRYHWYRTYEPGTYHMVLLWYVRTRVRTYNVMSQLSDWKRAHILVPYMVP
jgi:hypothetical protein